MKPKHETMIIDDLFYSFCHARRFGRRLAGRCGVHTQAGVRPGCPGRLGGRSSRRGLGAREPGRKRRGRGALPAYHRPGPGDTRRRYRARPTGSPLRRNGSRPGARPNSRSGPRSTVSGWGSRCRWPWTRMFGVVRARTPGGRAGGILCRTRSRQLPTGVARSGPGHHMGRHMGRTAGHGLGQRPGSGRRRAPDRRRHRDPRRTECPGRRRFDELSPARSALRAAPWRRGEKSRRGPPPRPCWAACGDRGSDWRRRS